MFPFKTSLQFNRKSKQLLYLQLSNQFITLIKEKKLLPKTKLPGSRTLAEILGVHRKTIVACYDELVLQGWLESIAKKGTYIHADLPELQHQEFVKESTKNASIKTGFQFYKDDLFQREPYNLMLVLCV